MEGGGRVEGGGRREKEVDEGRMEWRGEGGREGVGESGEWRVEAGGGREKEVDEERREGVDVIICLYIYI